MTNTDSRPICPYCGKPKTLYNVTVGQNRTMPVYICLCPEYKALLKKYTAEAKEKAE